MVSVDKARHFVHANGLLWERALWDYLFDDGSTARIELSDERLIFRFVSPARGVFGLVPLSEDLFVLEDYEIPLVFESDSTGEPLRMTMQVSPDATLKGEKRC